jgi:hypothetical protein
MIMSNEDVSRDLYKVPVNADVAELADEQSGYKIYLRVPANIDNISVERIQDFVEKFAKLLSDEDKNITVEVYGAQHDALELESLHINLTGQQVMSETVAEATDKVAYAYGGPGSALIPMYVCHNKGL